MCLKFDRNFHPIETKLQAFMAYSPILVYKRLVKSQKPNVAYSPYYNAAWTFGVQKKSKFTFIRNDNNALLNGVNWGLHAFITTDTEIAPRAYVSPGQKIYPAIIPVGARFYLGIDGEIVSDIMTVYKNKRQLLAAFGVKEYGSGITRNSLNRA